MCSMCLGLPAALSPKDVTLHPFAGTVNGPMLACGDGAVEYAECAIGWSRFEQIEFYPDTHKICGRFKNWSDNRDIVIRIEVKQK
ncbi:hypothetical protein ACPOL_6786 (plasmid) [Acidisarcina polymorpha]|uniref:Uncharacterized protein n=1 Tax=Acidisarcina polymorpha TaxID=2211140 RepID=A0A2Z5GBH2_9BACT|nr:hypothetical protein ACPOL_6786 [Acidisarcina polymorpha]